MWKVKDCSENELMGTNQQFSSGFMYAQPWKRPDQTLPMANN